MFKKAAKQSVRQESLSVKRFQWKRPRQHFVSSFTAFEGDFFSILLVPRGTSATRVLP
jgi:hypothetical protein